MQWRPEYKAYVSTTPLYLGFQSYEVQSCWPLVQRIIIVYVYVYNF